MKVVVVTKEMEQVEEIERHAIEIDECSKVEFIEEEYNEHVNFVLQRILLASKDEGQHKNMFKIHYSIKSKVCNLIVDNGSTKNLVSHKLVDYLKFSTPLYHLCIFLFSEVLASFSKTLVSCLIVVLLYGLKKSFKQMSNGFGPNKINRIKSFFFYSFIIFLFFLNKWWVPL